MPGSDICSVARLQDRTVSLKQVFVARANTGCLATKERSYLRHVKNGTLLSNKEFYEKLNS